MLNFGKNFALCATKKKYILTLVLSETKFLNETKNHNPPPPPFKLNGRSHRIFIYFYSTLGYMTKTLNQIIFFPSIKIRICFSATLGVRIFF